MNLRSVGIVIKIHKKSRAGHYRNFKSHSKLEHLNYYQLFCRKQINSDSPNSCNLLALRPSGIGNYIVCKKLTQAYLNKNNILQ